MQWWANEPIIFVREGDLESTRIRLLIAEKQATCAVRILDADEPIPDFLHPLNPEGIYPLLVCKGLACYGHAMEELLHERYDAVSLLPRDAIGRAQMRLLSEQVRSWYRLRPMELRSKFYELASAFDPHLPFFASQEISVLDIAIAPILFDIERIQYQLTPGAPFSGYVRMLVGRPSFGIIPRPQLVFTSVRASPHAAPRLGVA